MTILLPLAVEFCTDQIYLSVSHGVLTTIKSCAPVWSSRPHYGALRINRITLVVPQSNHFSSAFLGHMLYLGITCIAPAPLTALVFARCLSVFLLRVVLDLSVRIPSIYYCTKVNKLLCWIICLPVNDELSLNHPNLEFIEGDVLEHQLVAELVASCDAVLHLAAIASVPQSIANPIYTFQVNTRFSARARSSTR